MKNDTILNQLAAGHPATPRRSARRPWATLGTVLVLAAGAGAGWTFTHRDTGKPDAGVVKKAPVLELAPGDTVLAEARALRIVLPISGALTALNQATVKAKVAGEVRETPVAEGMHVARGQVVVRLDAADLRARLVAQHAAQDDARARLALARKNRENNLALLTQQFISQNAVDAAENSVELAQATLRAAESQVDIAQRAVADAVIRAPIDGIISKRYVQPGEKAAPDTPVFAIVNLQHLILEAQVPASAIPKVAIGQQVGFTVEGFARRAFAGRVVRINPAAESGSRAITVYVAVDNTDGALRSGMFAKGGITLQRSASLPVVPVAAVHQANGVPVVWCVDSGTVVAQPVRLGLQNEDEGLVQVTEGLLAGSRVILARLDNVAPGTRIRLPAPQGASRTAPMNAAPASAPPRASVAKG